MTLTAMLYVDNDPAERRNSSRRQIGATTTVRRPGIVVDAVLHDLSSTGASIESSMPLAPGSTVTIGLAGVGRFAATVVTATGSRAGCRFIDSLPPDAIGSAFAHDPVVTGAFGSDSAGLFDEPVTIKYPGYVRVTLPVAGAIGGWLLVVEACRTAFN